MATLVLTAVGTLVGGPIGGAVGALIGQQVDSAIIGAPTREGPRLQELAVSTSSYGQAISRVHGTMRVAGSIIWSTDLIESSETSGGKGRPKTTTYSYSASLAVAVSSRPIQGIGRIWADGNLLRGAAGDLKVAGTLRVYNGRGDQALDSLLASAEGGTCPAFRDCAYIVLEDLDLTEFGNRIPALSFEVIADSSAIELSDLTTDARTRSDQPPALAGLEGYALDGGSLAGSLLPIGELFPLTCDASSSHLRFLDPEQETAVIDLPASSRSTNDADFGQTLGQQRARHGGGENSPQSVRHYDPARDFQPNIQRSAGPTPNRGQSVIEFPGVLSAQRAKELGEQASQRSKWSRDRLSWRMIELDPRITPGSIVRVPGHTGTWLVVGWEWHEQGIELSLLRRRPTSARDGGGDTGHPALPRDESVAGSIVDYFELPWDGVGSPQDRQVYVAASTSGRSSALAIFAQEGSTLSPTGASARNNAVAGSLAEDLAPSSSLRFEPMSEVRVTLMPPSAQLLSCSPEELLLGKNRMLIGEEIIQFASAEPIGQDVWRLTGLLRGRGGTEARAQSDHEAGTRIILLNSALIPMDSTIQAVGLPETIAAIGLGDQEPVVASLSSKGRTTRPLCPVHPRIAEDISGARTYCWTRRARGAWSWSGDVEVPLVEENERYLVGIGDPDDPTKVWELSGPTLTLSASEYSTLQSGLAVWVRQIGSYAMSDPLLLETIG